MTTSIRIRLHVLALTALLLAVATPSARAQGASVVAVGDLAYKDLDRLSELGVLDSVVMGQRPYSRREMARILSVARRRLDAMRGVPAGDDQERTAAAAVESVRRLERRFGDVLPTDVPSVIPVDGAALTATSTGADRRGFPAPFSKPTEATIDPLAERRLGRPALRGQVVSLELAQRIEPTSWLAVQARERVEGRHPYATTSSSTDGELLLAFARARFRNAAITVGRQQVAWAQGVGDGLFLSSDAPALDQISLSGDHPFELPGALHHLGPTQATLVIADLGPSIVRTHSKLLAYKVSVQPAGNLELGGTFMDHYGGEGGSKSSRVDQIIDFLPFIDVFRRHNYRDTTRPLDVDSDKLLGVDGRLRLPSLGGLLLYGEMLIDDFDVHRLPYLLTGDGSQTLGVVFPQLGSPSLSLKLSAKHMGFLTYTHTQLTDGITTRGRLLGEELGPDAKSYAAQLRWTPSAAVRLEVEGRSAIYSNATYSSYYEDPGLVYYTVFKVSSTPDELRDIALASLILQSDEGPAVTVRLGGERTRNADFQGVRRHDYVAQVAVRFGQ